LASLSAVANGGALGQIGDIIHNFSAAVSGREGDYRALIDHLNSFVGMLDQQKDNIVASIDGLNRLASTFAEQRPVITNALQRIPPALDVLLNERQRITTALEKLGTFSDVANRLINDSQADLVQNLKNLEPTIKVLADLGPDLDLVLSRLPIFPFSQSFIDRAIRGDYMNEFIEVDATVPRLKRTLFLGTRWGDVGAPLNPAPGDPWYLRYTYDPLNAATNPPPPAEFPQAEPAPLGAPIPPDAPPPAGGEVPMPVSPPPLVTPVAPAASPIFTGPYAAAAAQSPDPGAAAPAGPTEAPPAPGGG
jgi:ABC-type transporter Mla subunit MlaD